MSKFLDEIKENINAFKEPLMDNIQNLKDNIEDFKDDMKDHSSENESHKKGGFSKFLSIIIVFLIISFICNECGSGESVVSSDITRDQAAINNEDGQSNEMHIPYLQNCIEYAESNSINVIRFHSEEETLTNWLNTADYETPIYLETRFELSGTVFKRTEYANDYVYFGELDNNKPNGYGVLFRISDIPYGAAIFGNGINNYYYNYYYIGNFDNRKFNGFGLLFDTEQRTISTLISLSPYHEESDEFHNYYINWENSVEYFGMFSNGEISGNGNRFYICSTDALSSDYNLNNITYTQIEIGEFDNNALNGNGSIYLSGYLYYNGKFKNGEMHGKGDLYYLMSEQLEYSGEFKNDNRHGYGTSYSKDGDIIYKGEWENDDYK